MILLIMVVAHDSGVMRDGSAGMHDRTLVQCNADRDGKNFLIPVWNGYSNPTCQTSMTLSVHGTQLYSRHHYQKLNGYIAVATAVATIHPIFLCQ